MMVPEDRNRVLRLMAGNATRDEQLQVAQAWVLAERKVETLNQAVAVLEAKYEHLEKENRFLSRIIEAAAVDP